MMRRMIGADSGVEGGWKCRFGRMSGSNLIDIRIDWFFAADFVRDAAADAPLCHPEPGSASFVDALFTATSATCVTGLIVHDTVQYWTPFGQTVILLLIQVGGMGVVTMAVAIFMFSGKKIGLKQRWVMQESIAAPQVGGIVRMTGFILKTAFAIETLGAVLLAFRFCPQMGFFKGYGMLYSIRCLLSATQGLT